MDDPDGSYAPQSPDLSAYHSAYPSEPTQSSYYPQQKQQTYQQTSYQPPGNYDQFAFGQQPLQSQGQYQPSNMSRNGRIRNAVDDDEWTPAAATRGLASNGKKQKVEVECDKPAPGVEEGIEVKTKFPVARIKRIMQADEDVGKVAQVTPTAVSKALELFMISVITKSANEARNVSAKRVTAAHLKNVVMKESQLDFLKTIVEKVPDAPAPKKDEDSEEGVEVKKKRGVTKKRKKDADI